MKTLQWIILCGCLVSASPCSSYESLQGPTEVLFHNKEKAHNGYTLFSSRGAWLIDMRGRVVHTWKFGTNPNGSDTFKQQRPGWDTPTHALLVENKVSVVFHGHDHFYAKQDLDGIVYQLVPQPGHIKTQHGAPRSAAEYGYRDGVLLGNSGHLRVSVTPAQATVDYVRSYLPDEEEGILKNAGVLHSYTIKANRGPDDLPQTEE